MEENMQNIELITYHEVFCRDNVLANSSKLFDLFGNSTRSHILFLYKDSILVQLSSTCLCAYGPRLHENFLIHLHQYSQNSQQQDIQLIQLKVVELFLIVSTDVLMVHLCVVASPDLELKTPLFHFLCQFYYFFLVYPHYRGLAQVKMQGQNLKDISTLRIYKFLKSINILSTRKIISLFLIIFLFLVHNLHLNLSLPQPKKMHGIALSSSLDLCS